MSRSLFLRRRRNFWLAGECQTSPWHPSERFLERLLSLLLEDITTPTRGGSLRVELMMLLFTDATSWQTPTSFTDYGTESSLTSTTVTDSMVPSRIAMLDTSITLVMMSCKTREKLVLVVYNTLCCFFIEASISSYIVHEITIHLHVPCEVVSE
jgi:hypothetical protein